MNSKEFFAKAKGTILEEEIGVLFNLYCVYKDIRPAYLHYSRTKEISTKSQIEVIKKLFPFFKTTHNKYRFPYSNKIDKHFCHIYTSTICLLLMKTLLVRILFG